MLKKFKILFEKLRNYQTEGITSKIEVRRAQVFNYTILIECVILLVNCIRHYYLESYNSVLVVGLALLFLVFLYLTKMVKRENKYVIFITLGLLVTFFFIHYIDNTKDIIQVFIVVLVSTGVFLTRKRFYFMFLLSIFFYYFTFFNLGYHKIYNPLGVLSFVFLTLMMRLFIKDAEENEVIIENQVAELKEIDGLKSRLFANISHEIRTPLTLILGANEQNEASKFSQIIKSNANKLLELVNQILELSKIGAKQRKPQIAPIYLDEYIQQNLVNNFESLAVIKELRFSYSKQLNQTKYFIDEDALYKIISNLLMNAFKFSNSNDTVSLQLIQENDQFLKIIVSDTGKGIDEENLPYIFEQFYHSKVGLEASSGIGLALVKNLVNSLSGKIQVVSKINQGSTFSISLPCLKEHYYDLNIQVDFIDSITELNHSVTYNSEDIVLAVDIDGSDKHIVLLVEDNDELRSFVKEILSEKFKVIEAVNGIDGIEKAKQFIPDIIVSDVMMPKMDGLEMLKNIKNEITTSHIPVILLTAKAEEKDIIEGLSLKADDYITKPFHKKELLYRIQNKLNFIKELQSKYKLIIKENLVSNVIDSKEDKFLQILKIGVIKNLSDSTFGPEQLALEVGLSSSQIFRKLKALTNISTSIYIRNIRLEEAKILLANQSASISEIAYETGFTSPAYFGKCFKEYTSYSPKDFQTTLLSS
jgi:signal transduction histidine kinase/CheY-like chemotaxis protein